MRKLLGKLIGMNSIEKKFSFSSWQLLVPDAAES
jgi:hypothetical protein